MDIGSIFDLIIINPILNVMVVLSNILFHNFGLAIIVLTLIVRFALFPLTLKQQKSTKAMSDLQPKLQEIQQKYANNKEKLAQEQAKIMKDSNFNPLGCLWPMLIQFPIWIALYQTIRNVMATTPEAFLSLSDRLYSWSILYDSLPIETGFLWFDMTTPDFFLALIVGVLTYIQTRMAAPNKASGKQPTGNDQAGMQTRMMQVMMPMMFMMFSIIFPSGLALYWATGAVFTIVSTFIMNKGSWGAFGDDARSIVGMFKRKDKQPAYQTTSGVKQGEVVNNKKDNKTNETSGNKRADSGTSSRSSAQTAKSSKKSGRSKRYK